METIKQVLEWQQKQQVSITTNKIDYPAALKQFLTVANEMLFKIGKPAYVIDKENEKVLQQIIEWFCGGGLLNPNKGLLLAGNTGSGKTLMIKGCTRAFGGIQYKKNCIDIANEFEEEGSKSILKHSKPTYKQNGSYPYRNAFYDDLGAETIKKHYGNDLDVMGEVIFYRNELFCDYGTKTIYTTNLNNKAIRERYGDRIEGRLRDTCNFVVLGNNISIDRRK